MLDLLLTHPADERHDDELVRAFAAHEAAVLRPARAADRAPVGEAESEVSRAPAAAFSFDTTGAATLTAAGHTWHAGRFEPLSTGELRARAGRAPDAKRARVRFWVLAGDSPATDIGSLQSRASAGTLFQVASQFNCLEAPWEELTSVVSYFGDPTQGPRASISAFPGTLLRHYRAPGPRGVPFVQTNDGPQIELLRDVCEPGVATVRNGYLRAANIPQPKTLSATLESCFDAIRVGVHDDVEVVRGYNWDGLVSGRPRIAQVFTSTLAAGHYGSAAGSLLDVCRQLLRAAYLGTLLAAASLGRERVVLTLIGGGAFGNPPRLIWESILWALDQAEAIVGLDLDVVVNGRNLGEQLDRPTILEGVRARGGVLIVCPRGGPASVHR